MSKPAKTLMGRPASEDRVPDSETTMVPVILGYSDSPSSLRLRLRFDDRELIVDERALSITIGRAEENDVVLKSHLSSRLHACIVLGRSNFVLIDESTNGTFVRTANGQDLFVHRDILELRGAGMIGVGCVPELGSQHTIHFTCEFI